MTRTALRPLRLPDALPADAAIQSSKQSKVCYEPEFWEFEYQGHRYLSSIELPALQQRYVDVAKNLGHLVSPERHVIPLNSFLSSWYWYRKEHQTRLELHLRGQSIPVSLPAPVSVDHINGPRRPKHPNSGDVLYRYTSEQRAGELATRGAVRMWHADYYAKLEKDPARQDEEMSKTNFLNGASTTVTTMGGLRIPVIGDVKVAHSGPAYYLLCMSCDWDPRLYDDFKVGHCAVVTRPDEFAHRLALAASESAPGWWFHHNPVEYYDPYELPSNSCIRHANSKDFRFAYQREYRFLLQRLELGPEPLEYLDIAMGPMDDCVELHAR